MTPAEQRAQAERMKELAARAKDPDVHASYLKLAADWQALADSGEEMVRRLERKT